MARKMTKNYLRQLIKGTPTSSHHAPYRDISHISPLFASDRKPTLFGFWEVKYNDSQLI